ncbi:VOC family protein [Azospirillum formosense]|uniref:VOC family protein n=1 Tax=Azospirillum formosense TaxID=861533 RepID=A0ABX2KWW9_9PROT|nr:VOC family protein [Azospirillum formosense]MBY3753142.1 VOC family protein [Azospirillum formosense]NUB19837.1 VOC family protein [Azospirillum formosense]
MGAHGINGIDHLVIVVRDLEKAQDAYRRMGFTISPMGRHGELKSANHTLMFGAGDYLELLAIEQPHPFTAFFSDVLKTREGIAAAALKTDDARAAQRLLVEAGYPAGEPVEFGRPVELPGGAQQARFTTTAIDGVPEWGGRVFLCQHHTRDVVWRPELIQHDNTVTGLAALVVAADDPDATASSYARLFGTAVETRGPARVVPTGSAPIVVADPAALQWGWTGDPALAVPRPFLAGVVLTVADLERAQQALQKSKFPTVVGNGVLRVSSASACGAMLAFAKEFDLGALIP